MPRKKRAPLTIAASAPRIEHLAKPPLLRRTNSMSLTHALKGGVRSTARLSRPGADAVYTTLYYTGEESPEDVSEATDKVYEASSVTKVDESATTRDARLSRQDAEVSVIAELETSKFRVYLLEMKKGEKATLEFHGNYGPCDACKARIERLAELLAIKMYRDTSLETFVYYYEKAYTKERGKIHKTMTTYGYEECITRVTYNNRLLYCKLVSRLTGSCQRNAPKVTAAASAIRPSGNLLLYNPYSVLGEQSQDEEEA